MWLQSDSCYRQHKTDQLAPDSSKTQTPPDPIIGSTAASFAFLLPESPPSELSFIFPRITRTARSYS
jgi:hypothetical protein